jgi:hypothetical protein
MARFLEQESRLAASMNQKKGNKNKSKNKNKNKNKNKGKNKRKANEAPEQQDNNNTQTQSNKRRKKVVPGIDEELEANMIAARKRKGLARKVAPGFDGLPVVNPVARTPNVTLKPLPGENYKKFSQRLHRETQLALNAMRNNISTASKEKRRSKMADAQATRKQKKREKKARKEEDAQELLQIEEVEFGDIVHKPPSLNYKPKLRVQPKLDPNMTPAEQIAAQRKERVIEMQRDKAIASYKAAKLRRNAHQAAANRALVDQIIGVHEK